MRVLLICLGLASPAAADVPTRDILEAPDRIWIRETLHPSAEMAITIPFLSYVTFSDQRVDDVMATLFHAIAPDSCEDIFNCPEAVSSNPIYTSSYTLAKDGINLTDLRRSPLNFDRPETAMALNSDSFTRGQSQIPLSYEDGAITRQTPGGAVRYLAAEQDDVTEILGIAAALEISISVNYDCLVSGHVARTRKTSPDDLSVALLALAEFGAVNIALQAALRDIRKGDTVVVFDLPESDAILYRQIQTQQMSLRMISSDLMTTYADARAGNDAATLPALPSATDVFAELTRDDPVDEELAATLSEQAELARQALPALFYFENQTADRGMPSDLLCHAR